ncbi:M16 family metallopeptidase, partial [Thermodesulfobacteriota bacterium]
MALKLILDYSEKMVKLVTNVKKHILAGASMEYQGSKMRTIKCLLKSLFAVIIVQVCALGISFAAGPAGKLNTNVKEFTLKNGMMFLVVERHTTPQVACRLAIRAGSALEEAGKTGIAHLLEHMMFKGTKNFGTLDAEKDQELQAKIERAYQMIKAEQQKRRPDRRLIREKLEEMNELRSQVQEIYVPQAFSMQLQKNGAVGVNAFTSNDQTQFTASVPSDMIEQWFSIISEQVFEPSWREFYVEKEVVQREWAFRYVNNPEGAAWLDLNATAYTAHPYRNPVIGWKSDMEMYSTADAIAFHKKYYTPSNTVCVLVGDITVDKARNFAETYFERYPAGGSAPESVTREPEQVGLRKSLRYLKGARKPIVMIGFHGAKMGTRDFYALDAINMILSTGHSARMKQDIEEMGLAQEAWSWNPDNRYGGIFVLGGSPNEPEEEKAAGLSDGEMSELYLKACEELKNILVSQLEKLKEEFVPVAELRRIKKLSQSDFLRSLKSNEKF